MDEAAIKLLYLALGNLKIHWKPAIESPPGDRPLINHAGSRTQSIGHYRIRSQRQLMEQLDYNLLFRWFLGLSMDASIWDATVYSKNWDRPIEGDVAARFMQAVLGSRRVKTLLSDEHFSVDGTLIDAWALMKSFRPKDGGGDDAPPPGLLDRRKGRRRMTLGAGQGL